jgi:hypothetical protein
VCADICADPQMNPCGSQECQMINHQPVCVKVCQCQRHTDCQSNAKCDGCNCIIRKSIEISFVGELFANLCFTEEDPLVVTGCEHCPPGMNCDISTGVCFKGKLSGSGNSSMLKHAFINQMTFKRYGTFFVKHVGD